jgi:manganese transport protein
MQGLLRRRVPLLVRRLATLVPALVILAVGVEPTWALVLSQVVLSFGVPFALLPLVWITARLKENANHRWTTILAGAATALIVALNLTLIVLTLT